MKHVRISEIKPVLDGLGVRPSKALGQNFLVDANILALLLKMIDAGPTDRVLEIGPGLGALTLPLADLCDRIMAVEKDRRLWKWLSERLAGRPNVELILADILDLDINSILNTGVTKVVSNLPYATGSAILANLLMSDKPPAQMILTLQSDVAARVTAEPGRPNFGLLSVWSQLFYDVTIKKIIAPGCFYPAPKVKSAAIHLLRNNLPLPGLVERKMFFSLTKSAFMHRRKQLKTLFRTLPEQLGVSQEQLLDACRLLNIDTAARPETLSAHQWLALGCQLIAKPRSAEP